MSPFKKAPVEEPKAPGAEISHHSLVELFQERNTLKRKLDEAEAERAVLRADVTDLGKRAEEAHRASSPASRRCSWTRRRARTPSSITACRAVWDLCRNQIRNIAEELSGRQDQVERKRYTEAYEQQRAASIKDTPSGSSRSWTGTARPSLLDIARMEAQIPALKRFWHKKKRERLMEEIEEAMTKFPPIDKRRMELVKKLDGIKKAPLPTYLGIGVPARRAINVAMIAMAQYLYLHFTEHEIAPMARSAGLKPVMDVNFGGANECLKIGAQMWEVVMKLKADTLRPDKLKLRAEFLRQKLTYANDQESIPEEHSLDYLLPSDINSTALDTTVTAIPVNVLHLDFLLGLAEPAAQAGRRKPSRHRA